MSIKNKNPKFEKKERKKRNSLLILMPISVIDTK